MGSWQPSVKALGLDQNEIRSLERALDGFSTETQQSLGLRLVIIEYETPFGCVEGLEAICNADLGETVYRVGTLFSRFKHAKLVVLESPQDVLKGFCWEISEENKQVIFVSGGMQAWTLSAESKLVFKAFTNWSNDEITEAAKSLCSLADAYNLTTNNCESFCNKLGDMISVGNPFENSPPSMLSLVGRVQQRHIDMGSTPLDRLVWVIKQVPGVQQFLNDWNLGSVNRTNLGLASVFGVPLVSFLLLRWIYRIGQALPSVDAFVNLLSNLL